MTARRFIADELFDPRVDAVVTLAKKQIPEVHDLGDDNPLLLPIYDTVQHILLTMPGTVRGQRLEFLGPVEDFNFAAQALNRDDALALVLGTACLPDTRGALAQLRVLTAEVYRANLPEPGGPQPLPAAA